MVWQVLLRKYFNSFIDIKILIGCTISSTCWPVTGWIFLELLQTLCLQIEELHVPLQKLKI